MGIHSFDQIMSNPLQRFENKMYTDGYSYSAQFSRPKLPLIEQGLNHLLNFQLHEDDRFEFVDPDVTDIFCSVNKVSNDSNNPATVKRYSTKQYYHEAGFFKTQDKRLHYLQNDVPIQNVLSSMPPKKTSRLESIIVYIQHVLHHYHSLQTHFDVRYSKLKFQNFVGKQNALNEVVRCLTWRSKKYGPNAPQLQQTARQPAHEHRWRNAPIVDLPNSRIYNPHDPGPGRLVIVVGDGSFSPSMAGKLTTPKKAFYKRLQQVSRLLGRFEDGPRAGRQRLVVMTIDEYRTSKVFCTLI